MIMTKKQKKRLTRILIALVCYLALALSSLFVNWNSIVLLIGYLCIYVYISYDVLKKTWKNILNKDFMDENFLMTIASLGAFVLGEYSESVAVMLFYQIGEWFQDYAVDKSRKNIADMMDIAPEYANLEKDGKIEEVEPDEVEIGQTIVIKPGERIPLDGTVITGDSTLDTSALTGESVPRIVRPGMDVISGCVNQSGVLKVRVTRTYENSTVARILDLVENATDKKSRSEKFITKFAKVYTPVVVFSAITLALIPSVLTGDYQTWVYRALEFLVISCPCALVISVPLSFFGGIGGASRCGILIKGSNYLQEMDHVKTIVFDKTGTLTKGTFEVVNVQTNPDMPQLTREELIQMACKAERFSTHPIALSILKAGGYNPADLQSSSDSGNIQEIAGKGITLDENGTKIAVGNAKLMDSLGITNIQSSSNGYSSTVYVAKDKAYCGMIEVADEPKEEARTVLDLLRKEGVRKFVMLTGDHAATAEAIAKKDGIDEVHAELLPQQKVEWLERILQDSNEKNRVAYVGDGINDAPVLTRADIGIAMGALGSDAAIEAADIVLMDDQLISLVTLMNISRKTMRIAMSNIVFAIAVKVLMLILGAFGIVNMWGAVFADVGVSVICILNAMRAMRMKKQTV